MYIAITSMDEKYYNLAGKRMLQSYLQFKNNSIPLFVYNEGNFEPEEKVNLLGWNLGEDYNEFNKKQKNARVKTFGKKGFSIIHAMYNFDCAKIIWIDADTEIKKPISKKIIDEINPRTILSTHFGVRHKWPSEQNQNRTAYSCETGFFVLNKIHNEFSTFRETYKKIYTGKRKEEMRRFYDGEIYGKTVEILNKQGIPMIDLNQGGHKTPIPRSVMGDYISHYKAGLKHRVQNEI